MVDKTLDHHIRVIYSKVEYVEQIDEIDLTKAIFIGDDQRDIKAGNAAGCKVIMTEPDRGLLEIVKSLLKLGA